MLDKAKSFFFGKFSELLIYSLGLFFLFTTGFLFAKTNKTKSNSKLPKIVIISTGGTIASTTDSKTNVAIPTISGKDLIAQVPEIAKIADVQVIEFSNIDSSQMTPEIWSRLSRITDKVLKDPAVKGAVITHGTDTMSEGAYFLNLTLKTTKPVVFVGAMRSSSHPYPDGPFNLLSGVFIKPVLIKPQIGA